jgi:hypothetical protein
MRPEQAAGTFIEAAVLGAETIATTAAIRLPPAGTIAKSTPAVTKINFPAGARIHTIALAKSTTDRKIAFTLTSIATKLTIVEIGAIQTIN